MNFQYISAQISFGFMAKSVPAENAYATAAPADARTDPSIPVLNSALKAFYPSLMSEEYLRVIHISRRMRTSDFSSSDAEAYQGTINSDAVKIAGIELAAKQGLCKSYRARPEYSSTGTMYWVEEIDHLGQARGQRGVVLSDGTWVFTKPEAAT